VDFLTRAFSGADALYLLIPPKLDAEDVREYYNEFGLAAVTAIRRSGIGKVVFLSSLGADKTAGTGPVTGLHDVEELLETLDGVDIVILRPGFFMENLLQNMEMIRTKAINGSAMAADVPVAMVAAADIGAKAAELLMDQSFSGRSIVEIVGDRISFAEVTAVLGNVLGIHNMPYIQFADNDAEASLIASGLSRSVARSFVELMRGLGGGLFKTTQGMPDQLSAPTRFPEFAEKVYKPIFVAAQEHAMV
jgi:uncharacterized protein YbjT (DUF2867 family)